MQAKQRLLATTTAACLLLAPAACGPSFSVQTPDGFVELEDQEDYDYRATTAQGVVIGVRAQPNKPKGHLDFWVDAIDLRLRAQGYKAESAKDVKAASGLPGRQIRYSFSYNGLPHTFWLTVFVTDSTVYCVEAGGDSRSFEKVKDAVSRGVASLSGK
jgi:hypothetical protein